MEYKVIYSDRKTVNISVKDGSVTIKAPRRIKKEELLRIIEKHKAWIDKAIVREREKREKYEALSEAEIKGLKKSAREYLTEKCEYFSRLMGLEYNRITITSAKTRFGACSSAKNISFSYRLMLYPEPAREYVVVHELAHLKEMNHSKKFYTVVEKYLPDYKERKKLLKM